MRTSLRYWAVLALISSGVGLPVGCGTGHKVSSQTTGSQNGEWRSIGGGRQIRVVEVQRDAGPPRTIEVEYWTAIPFVDRSRLQEEVDQVWTGWFEKEAESAGAARAYVLPRAPDDPEHGLTRRTTSFVYVRNDDGTWSKDGGFGSK